MQATAPVQDIASLAVGDSISFRSASDPAHFGYNMFSVVGFVSNGHPQVRAGGMLITVAPEQIRRVFKGVS